MMDGNKEESLRCIDLALNYMKLGDRAKAKRFLTKSEQLYPSQKAKGRSTEFVLVSFLDSDRELHHLKNLN